MASFVWSQDFDQKSNETYLIAEYFRQERERLKLTSVTSCVLANVSSARVPSALLKDCLPRVQRFSCLSSSRDALDVLSKELQTERQKRHGGLEVRLKVQRAQTWSCPTAKVDAVFLMDLDSRMSDYEFPGFLRRCLGWLTPGGVLYILFRDACAEWNDVMRRVSKGSSVSMFERVGKSLRRAGLEVEEKKAFEINVDAGELNRNVLNHFIQRLSTEKEYRNFARKIKENFPNGRVTFISYLTICRKK